MTERNKNLCGSLSDGHDRLIVGAVVLMLFIMGIIMKRIIKKT